MAFTFRNAISNDIAKCIEIRGKTRENAVSVQRLAELGVTHASWSASVADGTLAGILCLDDGEIVGYCFGDKVTGEVVVLALLPNCEGKALGKQLLNAVVRILVDAGHRRLFLGCSPKPHVRSFGFYRHLGWKPTGRVYDNLDEELEFIPKLS